MNSSVVIYERRQRDWSSSRAAGSALGLEVIRGGQLERQALCEGSCNIRLPESSRRSCGLIPSAPLSRSRIHPLTPVGLENRSDRPFVRVCELDGTVDLLNQKPRSRLHAITSRWH